MFLLFFILTFIYFYFFSAYVLFFQEQQFLFIFSVEFLQEHLIKPGGLLVLAGKFLTQFYSVKILGSFILAGILTLPGIFLFRITKRLFAEIKFPLILLIIPSCLMVMMQSHYYHMMEYNLGFLMILGWFLLSLKARKTQSRIIAILLFPLFYYLTGAYSMIYLAIYGLYILLFDRGWFRILYLSVLLITGLVTFFVFKELMFYVPDSQLIFYPLPPVNDQKQKILFYILTTYVVLFLPAGVIINRFKKGVSGKKYTSIISGLIAISFTLIFIIRTYNTQTDRVISLEELVFNEQWDKAIEYQEKYPSENMIGEYFYNIALSETDQLCDRLFYGRQDFGAGSLILPWSDDHLPWGSYFHYSTGLINEAHRWAYEEMVVYGYRPQNLKMLIKTNLINGHYRMAEKYINILKGSIFYRSRANEYEKFLDDSLAVASNPEFGKRAMILPQNDFFIYLEEPHNNLPLLLEANPGNRKAFEYITAWLLLTKNVEAIINNTGKLKEMKYTRIPRHIEEALLIHYSSTKKMPDLGGLSISSETLARFEQYTTAYKSLRQNSALSKETMQKRFGSTFWYYFQFK